MKYIQLTQGKQAVVDDEDFEEVNKYKWFSSTKGYAIAHNGSGQNRHTIQMHRLVMKFPNMQVDHKNNDKLDNRKSNLRSATNAQNKSNGLIHSKNSSGYKGVCWHKRDRVWNAHICFNYKKIHIGYFSDKTEAARAYDNKAKELFGEFANLNFKGVTS